MSDTRHLTWCRVRPCLGPLLVALVAVFVGRAVYESWDEALGYEWRFDPAYLLASVGLISLYYLQQWGASRQVCKSLRVAPLLVGY